MKLTDHQLEEVRALIARRGDCAGPRTRFPANGSVEVAILCSAGNWDDVIRWLAACEQHMDAMALEIQQRRAADLTPEDVEALRAWREDLRANAQDYEPGATNDTIPAIDKILRAHGAKP